MFTEFDTIADQIASDIPARFRIDLDEAYALARNFLDGESRETVDGVAIALYRSYQEG